MSRIGGDPLREEEAVGQHVRELVPDSFDLGMLVPLEALQELAGFDRDALGEVLRRVELRLIALGDEGAQCVHDLLVVHAFTLPYRASPRLRARST